MEQKKSTKYILIAISVLFIFVMLILPLFSILFSALKEGFAFYIQAVTTEYVRSALLVTLLATVIAVVVNTFFGIMAAWLLTKFSFRGKQVLATLIDIPFSISPVIVGLAFLMTFGRLGWTYPAIRAINQFFGTNIRITFALPGVVLATIFVTFPFVSREIIPILNAQGKDEEEAAALMGGKRIYDFPENYPSPDEMGTDLWYHFMYGACVRRVWSSQCTLKDQRADIYPAAGD